MKIILTGGAGFIGSHVANALLSDGHNVHVIDDLSAGQRGYLKPRIKLHVYDIRSKAAAECIARERFDVLVHHAAQVNVRHSVADPLFDAQINVFGFLNLLEAARQNGLQKVVFASSGGAIYGEPNYAPQDEQHALQPLSPYGITKLVAEKYLFFYQQQYGIPSLVLRYANIYGPRQNPFGEAGVVAIFMQRMLAGERPFINGDGLQTRDYTYVGDVVRANLAALRYEGTGVFNVGTSTETDVVTLFRMVRDLVNPEIEASHVEGKPGEQNRSVLCCKLAECELGWTPRVDLREGLKLTLDWFKQAQSLPRT